MPRLFGKFGRFPVHGESVVHHFGLKFVQPENACAVCSGCILIPDADAVFGHGACVQAVQKMPDLSDIARHIGDAAVFDCGDACLIEQYRICLPDADAFDLQVSILPSR